MSENVQSHDGPAMETKLPGRGRGAGGPLGLGDPNDTTLRQVEVHNLINKRIVMVVDVLCADMHQGFKECFSKYQTTSFIRCQKELRISRKCYKKWMDDEKVFKLCSEDYIKDRNQYRRTGEKLFESKEDQEKQLRARAAKFAEIIKNESG